MGAKQAGSLENDRKMNVGSSKQRKRSREQGAGSRGNYLRSKPKILKGTGRLPK